MRVVAGVDGGGTKTTVEIWSENGDFIKEISLGPFNLNGIREPRFVALLDEIFEAVNSYGECCGVCIGAAGISNPKVSRLALSAAERAGLADKLLLCGDHEIALYGASGGKGGIALIAGTGSICVGMELGGKTIRVGGWGHLIDDCGSGYAISRDALAAVVRASDGRGIKTILTELILAKLEANDIGAIISYVYDVPDKSRIAALAPLVEQAWRMEDMAAREIIKHNALELVKLVQAASARLTMQNPPLYLLGGLLTNDTVLKQEFERLLSDFIPEAHIEKPLAGPAQGAALMALERFT